MSLHVGAASRLPRAWRALLLAALCVPWAAPACEMPAPDGASPVGMQHFELVDPSRIGVRGDTAGVPRTLPALVWYPAAAAAAGPPRRYLTADEARVQLPALARNLRYDPERLVGIDDCTTYATEGAPPAEVSASFPLVVLSHGFFVYPAQNTVLAEHLASHGYVVVAIGHPGDAVDLALADGRVVPTNMEDEKPDFLAWRSAFHGAAEHAERAPLIDGYAAALAGSRLGDSVASWRDDMLFAADTLSAASDTLPERVRAVLRTADPERLALAGMSFGGSTAATACRLRPACRAVISLDGQNFDPELFDAELGRPLLLLLSDWVRFPMYDGLPSPATFNPNDYAYERWDRLGASPMPKVRLRVPGTRHMAFSDLPLLMRGGDRVADFGDADPDATARAIAAVTRAFLDMHVGDGGEQALMRAVDESGFVPHDPASTREWVRGGGARPGMSTP